jgi:hypothetical protein
VLRIGLGVELLDHLFVADLDQHVPTSSSSTPR